MSTPAAVRVRMYQVGFGDCFLVSFEYPGNGPSERHMLVDFGRNATPHAGGDMQAVARDIRQRTNGQLDLLVVTHRHEDHLSAFASSSMSSIIEDCNPKLIVRSWTEDPAAPEIAPGPALAARDHSFVRGLAAADGVARRIAESRFALEQTVVGRTLRKFAFDQVKNKEAIDRLALWSADGRGAYLSFGSDRLMSVLPGVEIEVLGPPTVAQYPALGGERDEDPEYWLALGRGLPAALEIAADTEPAAFSGRRHGAASAQEDGAAGAGTPPAPRPVPVGHASDAPAPGRIGPVRWLTEKLRKQQVASLLRIVRSLDDWLNNTSLILLVRAGDRRLLLAGDAQIENWSYALKALPDPREQTRILAELAQVDLYKVGHHGSRNATPRTLVGLWAPTAGQAREVISLMSTREGVYGDSYATEVPHARLMAALDTAPRRLISTLQDPTNPDPRLFREVWAPTNGGVAFAEP